MKKAFLWLMLSALLISLTGCAALDELSRSDALPDLRLLEQPAYEEPAPQAVMAEEDETLRVDLWLDASQVMGGINPNVKSMYPHSSRKYREGGFHYRYENQTGMYETVLRCMLSAAEGSRVRILRCGNERLPDEYLQDHVLDTDSAQELRSIRRDMLTWAIDPMPGELAQFSGEKMTDSFYTLGSPQMNRLPELNRRMLENPDLAAAMSQALDQQIHAVINGYDDSLSACADDNDFPLLYALRNLDLSRLSVITLDPAGSRRLSQTDENGDIHAVVEEILSERGVFDAGMTTGLYAFTLDYMGQMGSFGCADFSEPLLWGRLDYNNATGLPEGALVMPRTLLTLVIGPKAQADAFAAAFEDQLTASETLMVPRGPQDGQLTYTQDGQTVVQEPFGFTWSYTSFSRAAVETITQQTQGVSLQADSAQISKNGSLHTVTLAPVDGAQPDRRLTLTIPQNTAFENMTLTPGELTNVRLEVQSTLLLSDVLPNRPDTAIPEGAQSIPLRDSIYVFAPKDAPTPVSCAVFSSDGHALTVLLDVEGALLQPGYYRLVFSADLPGESLAWKTPGWIQKLNVNITNEQVSVWETFTGLLSSRERKRNYVSRPYQHAWGDASNTSYYGETVPDFPPVMLAPGLSALVEQLQAAAQPSDMPYIHFVFDLFVPNHPL